MTVEADFQRGSEAPGRSRSIPSPVRRTWTWWSREKRKRC